MITIVSNYKDYYDCAPKLMNKARLKKVPDVLWERKVKISEHCAPYYLQQDAEGIYAREITSNNEKLSLPNPPLIFDQENNTISFFVIGFCGKTYLCAIRNSKDKVARIKSRDWVFFYGEKMLELFPENSPQRKDIEMLVKQFDKVDNPEFFTKWQTPTFAFGLNDSVKMDGNFKRKKTDMSLIEKQNVVISPNLKSLNFNKIMNQISTYVEIGSFIKNNFNSTLSLQP